jgi:O-antigen ligase
MKDFFKGFDFENLFGKGYFSYLSAILTVLILSIHVQYLPPVMVLWGIFWILELNLRKDKFLSQKKSYILLFVLFGMYFIWQVLGIFYSENLKLGFQNIFGRLALILFPLILISPESKLKIKINLVIRLFAIGTLVYLFYCFGYALSRSVSIINGEWLLNSHPEKTPWLSYFYSSLLTVSQHPSYISMYVLLSILICFEAWYDISLKKNVRIFWLISGFILLISEYFLSSRIGIIGSLVLVPLYFVRKFYLLNKNKYLLIGIVVIIIALLPIIAKNQRVDYLLGRISGTQKDYIRKEDPRINLWKTSFDVILKNPIIGVGIGDVRTELAEELSLSGYEEMAKERLNAHNQFLEVLVENGIIGLIIFISIFVCMSYIAIKERNLLYGAFILIVIAFFMFESVLYRLAGVSFFSLFSFLLLHTNSKNQV